MPPPPACAAALWANSIRADVQVVVDVVPVALGVLPPPQREVGVLQEQRAVQHTLLVNLGPEQEDLHAAGHDAGVDVLLVVVVAKRETQDDRTRTSTLHLFFLNTDKSASDRDSLLQGHQDDRTRTSTLTSYLSPYLHWTGIQNSNFYITPHTSRTSGRQNSNFYITPLLSQQLLRWQVTFLLISSSSWTGILYFKDFTSRTGILYFKDFTSRISGRQNSNFYITPLLSQQHRADSIHT